MKKLALFAMAVIAVAVIAGGIIGFNLRDAQTPHYNERGGVVTTLRTTLPIQPAIGGPAVQ